MSRVGLLLHTPQKKVPKPPLRALWRLIEEIAAIQEKMKSKFVLTDQGELEYYLGVEVSKIDENTLLLHQTGYAKKILERFKTTAVCLVRPRDLNLSLMDSPDEVDPILQSEYRAIIGSLMYLYQWTRPDLGFAVTFLSRYLHRPGEKHLQAAKHTLRYLKGTELDTPETCTGFGHEINN